ncbi:DJ-1/PfpI family protein [Sulfobacillus thermosulfidooxidans]|uniref:DJ-1/PfpI family protein n=1 Tax=Sulfobacillus thermosulfidooxidans TaxID=28034 RepID=UPI001FA84D4B
MALAAADIMTGKTSVAYPALKSDVEATGAKFVDGAAVIDGHMVSARAWPDHPESMRGLMNVAQRQSSRNPLAMPSCDLPAVLGSIVWENAFCDVIMTAMIFRNG